MELCPKLMRHWFTRMQLASIWGGSWSVMLSSWFGQDIEDMMTLLEHKGGGEIIHKLGNYMKELDRKGDYGREKEPWVAAVVKAAANEGVVVWFVWGDGDTMAPKEIAQAFTDKVEVDLFGTHAQEGHCSPKHLILLEGCGHFGMLEQPEKVRRGDREGRCWMRESERERERAREREIEDVKSKLGRID